MFNDCSLTSHFLSVNNGTARWIAQVRSEEGQIPPYAPPYSLSPGPVQFTSYVSFKYLSVLLSIHADGNLNQAFFILYLVSEGNQPACLVSFFHSFSGFHLPCTHTALLWDKADHVMPFLKNLLWEDEYVCKCMWIVLTWLLLPLPASCSVASLNCSFIWEIPVGNLLCSKHSVR